MTNQGGPTLLGQSWKNSTTIPKERATISVACGSAPSDRPTTRVRVSFGDCKAIFRPQEPEKRMRDKAAHACRALCRARVAEELQRCMGTRIGEHLELVLSISRCNEVAIFANFRPPDISDFHD